MCTKFHNTYTLAPCACTIWQKQHYMCTKFNSTRTPWLLVHAPFSMPCTNVDHVPGLLHSTCYEDEKSPWIGNNKFETNSTIEQNVLWLKYTRVYTMDDANIFFISPLLQRIIHIIYNVMNMVMFKFALCVNIIHYSLFIFIFFIL